MSAPEVRSGTGTSAELFFEDLTPGRWFDLGVVTVDADEMVAFARRFDPQWYHIDEELARQSHHGGLIASGFYTVSLFMRAYVDHVLSRAAADASPGLEELRWLAPVRAGDRLAVRLDVMGSKPSTARPGLGTVTLTGTMLRLDDDGHPECEVLRTRFRGWFALRPSHDEPADVDDPVEETAPAGETEAAGETESVLEPAGSFEAPEATFETTEAATSPGAPVSAPPTGLPAPLPAPVAPVGTATPAGVGAPPELVPAPVSSVDAPTAVLSGPVVSAPPAPYGLDMPTAVIPASRQPQDDHLGAAPPGPDSPPHPDWQHSPEGR